MAELKTKPTGEPVEEYLSKIKDEERQADCRAIVQLLKQVTKAQPRMWGPGIVGFGDARLKYASGRELDWFVMGFSSRKEAIALYGLINAPESATICEQLGKFKTGKGCLYIKRLADVDPGVLKKLMTHAKKHPHPGC